MAESSGVGEEELTDEVKRIMDDDGPELVLVELDPHRKELAKLEATRRILTKPQERLQDVPVFPIDVGDNEDKFEALMTKVQHGMRNFQSLPLYGKPVSAPPVDVEDQQFYIIRLKKEGDPRHVDHLFQVSDMYYAGFKPSEEQCFFRFCDIELPKWIPSLPLPENSAHDNAIIDTTFGTHWWDQIFNTCLKCTSKDNMYKKKSESRHKVLKWTIFLLAEPARLRTLKGKVKTVISTGIEDKVGSSEEGIHSWKSMSKVGFRYTLEPTHIRPMKLLHQFTDYDLFNMDKKRYEPWKIIGSAGEILVFKYDEVLVTNIIKRQQDKALSALCSLLMEQPSPSGYWKRVIHPSQHPNILIYLAFLLRHGEGYSVEIRRDAGLLLERSLRKEFRSMVPAYRDYVKAQLVPCIWEENPLIRSAAGVVIIEVLRISHAEQWKELIESLQACLDSNLFEFMKAAMDLLAKICEEVPGELEIHVPDSAERPELEIHVPDSAERPELEIHVPDSAERPDFIFLTRWLKMFKNPHFHLRRLALECVNNCIRFEPLILDENIDHYVEVLICLYERSWAAEEENGLEEKLAAVKLMGSIAEKCISIAHPYLPKVIGVLTLLLREDVPSLLVAACETLSQYTNYMVQSLRYPIGCEHFGEILCSLFENITHSDGSVQSSVSLALENIEKEAATLEDVINDLNSDRDQFPLLRCLKSIAQAVQPDFCTFILPVFRGCTLLLAKGRDNEILCGSLGLLSTVLAEGLSAGNESPLHGMSASIEILIKQCGLIDMLETLCSDEEDDGVGQHALNLLRALPQVAEGESLAKVCSILARYQD